MDFPRPPPASDYKFIVLLMLMAAGFTDALSVWRRWEHTNYMSHSTAKQILYQIRWSSSHSTIDAMYTFHVVTPLVLLWWGSEHQAVVQNIWFYYLDLSWCHQTSAASSHHVQLCCLVLSVFVSVAMKRLIENIGFICSLVTVHSWTLNLCCHTGPVNKVVLTLVTVTWLVLYRC